MTVKLQLTLEKFVLVMVASILLLCIANPVAGAQSFKVLHSFADARDGANPLNGFTVSSTGVIYGTASTGGAYGNGVIFKLTAKGAETVVHPFHGGTKDGAGPHGFLVSDKAGNFYGTTSAGGTDNAGTVFELTGTKVTLLYSFTGQADGSDPEAGLAIDSSGNLYGTTTAGGASGNGAVFKLAAPAIPGGAWTESVLYSFGSGSDGIIPIGGVSLDSAGNLYGTTSANGAYGYGTVFQLVPGTSWTEHIIHNFQNGNDGAVPYAGLIPDGKGNFYGAATEGGSSGGGTVFELTPSNGNWNFSVVYSVPGWGISGSFRNVVLDPSTGNLYGTTHCDGSYNAGTVYELTPNGSSWDYSLLYTFKGSTDGLYSFSNLVLSQGKLYGTTKYGGAKNDGVIFEVTP